MQWPRPDRTHHIHRSPTVRKRHLTVNLVAALAVMAAVADASGQTTNPGFGVWKLKSDAPPPSVNIMTYEPYGDGGMRITVESTNSRGRESKWGYVTMFDGVFRPVTGQENDETAVEVVNERTTRISNMRNDRLSQVIINTPLKTETASTMSMCAWTKTATSCV